MIHPLVVSVALAVIALTSLVGAIYLQTQDIDATQAWAGFISSTSLLVGQQIPSAVRSVRADGADEPAA